MRAVSKAEYQQLLGLKLLADQHNAALKAIVEAGEAILSEERGGHGHVADTMYAERGGIDDLLRLLNLTVEP